MHRNSPRLSGKSAWLDRERREEVAYCAEHGIPPSIFRGRGMPAPGEPYWLDDDADEVLGYLREQAKACPNCGTRPDEWAADDTAYVPDLRRCRGCEELETARAAVPEGQRGVYAVLEPRAVAQARAEADDGEAVT